MTFETMTSRQKKAAALWNERRIQEPAANVLRNKTLLREVCEAYITHRAHEKCARAVR